MKISSLAILLSFASVSQAAQIEKEVSAVASFKSKSTSGLVKIDGEAGKVSGKMFEESGKLSGEVSLDVPSLTTKNELRDEHMHQKYLESQKFPKATLAIKSFTPGKDASWEGVLKIKNESKPVSGKASIDGKKFTAEFMIDLEKYPSIGVPSWLGVTVASSVNVIVEGTFSQ